MKHDTTITNLHVLHTLSQLDHFTRGCDEEAVSKVGAVSLTGARPRTLVTTNDPFEVTLLILAPLVRRQPVDRMKIATTE